jgi:hypothetical protein
MGDRSHEKEPEVFERLQRLALHERRRRWDSTRSALSAGSGDPDNPCQGGMPPELLTERFDSLEAQLAALARELRRVEHRSAMIALRARLAVALGLIAALACMGLWTGTLSDWILRLSR